VPSVRKTPTQSGTHVGAKRRADDAREKAFDARFSAPLLLAASLNPINSSMIATALVPISDSLGVAVGRTAMLVTALYVASAVAQPALGRFSQRFGPRRILLAGAALIVISGVVGSVADALPVLVVARVVLGIGTSAGFPTAMMMIHRRAAESGEEPGRTLGALVIASQVTVLAGLPLGGLLVGLAGWRATFWINVPLALLLLVLAWRWSPRDPPVPRAMRSRALLKGLDLPGMGLFAILLTLVVWVLVSLPDVRVGLAVAAAAAGSALFIREVRLAAPFIDIRSLMRNRPLLATYVRTSGTMLAAYCVMFGLTQWLQETRGLPTAAAGLLVVPMSAAGALVTPFVSRLGLVRMPLLTGAAFALVAASLLWLVMDTTPMWCIVTVTTLLGIAVGLTTLGNQSAAYLQSDAEEVGVAAGLLRTSGYVGAIASGSLISVMFRNGATDAGLHSVADVLVPVSLLVLLLTVVSRLPRAIEHHHA
jgi:MFS family permease